MPRRRATPRGARLADIARAVDGTLTGSGAAVIADLRSLDDAGPRDLTYVATERAFPDARRSRAAAFLVARRVPQLDRPQIVVANPAYAAACVVQRFFTAPYRARGIARPIARGRGVIIGPHPSIWPFVTLGARVRLGARVTLYPGVFIGDDCTLGDDTVVYPSATVLAGCRLGSRVIVGSGSVIGSDGFGFVPHGGRHHKVPQRGGVVIEDDVELGANVTVDRATYGHTVLGRGAKIDDQVHVAHNVTVGEHAILVAQVGIAGSTTVGKHVVMGGQVGVSDHLRIGDGAMIAAKSGVVADVEAGVQLSGIPARPHLEAARAVVALRHLPALRQRVRELERRVADLEARRARPAP
jgi:UDP-3-O-[3-hydroxymyristoyl] glucosamine N-acyltransferase